MIQHIFVDKNRIEYTDKQAYPILSAMEQTGDFIVHYGFDPLGDPIVDKCQIIVTSMQSRAEGLADTYKDKTVYLIEHPLNHGYKSTKSNLQVVWCWNDFQFFVYFPKKSDA